MRWIFPTLFVVYSAQASARDFFLRDTADIELSRVIDASNACRRDDDCMALDIKGGCGQRLYTHIFINKTRRTSIIDEFGERVHLRTRENCESYNYAYLSNEAFYGKCLSGVCVAHRRDGARLVKNDWVVIVKPGIERYKPAGRDILLEALGGLALEAFDDLTQVKAVTKLIFMCGSFDTKVFKRCKFKYILEMYPLDSILRKLRHETASISLVDKRKSYSKAVLLLETITQKFGDKAALNASISLLRQMAATKESRAMEKFESKLFFGRSEESVTKVIYMLGIKQLALESGRLIFKIHPSAEGQYEVEVGGQGFYVFPLTDGGTLNTGAWLSD